MIVNQWHEAIECNLTGFNCLKSSNFGQKRQRRQRSWTESTIFCVDFLLLTALSHPVTKIAGFEAIVTSQMLFSCCMTLIDLVLLFSQTIMWLKVFLLLIIFFNRIRIFYLCDLFCFMKSPCLFSTMNRFMHLLCQTVLCYYIIAEKVWIQKVVCRMLSEPLTTDYSFVIIFLIRYWVISSRKKSNLILPL